MGDRDDLRRGRRLARVRGGLVIVGVLVGVAVFFLLRYKKKRALALPVEETTPAKVGADD